MPGKLLKNKLVWLIAALIVGYLIFKNHDESGGDKKPAVAVRTALAEQKDVPLTLRNVGTIVTNDSVALRARIDSQVMEVKFRDGDYVQQGELLFILDDRELKAKLGELEANWQRDRAQLNNLRVQYERSKQLAGKGFNSQADLDNAKAAYESALATMTASEAAAENIKVQLEYTRIVAPISGRTGTINATVGNTVKAGDTQPMVTINQVKPIRASVALPQRYLSTVREAMAAGPVAVSALREGSAEPSEGVLEYIDNAVDQSTGTFAARASFPNDNEALWPGMFVTITITLGEEKNALTVPEVAIQHGQSGDFVFAVAEDKAMKRDVKIARLQEGVAVIESGLTPGEKVVVDGLMLLKDGSPVTMQATEKP